MEEKETVESELLTQKEIRDKIKAGQKWVKSGLYSGSEKRWKQWEKNKKYLMCVWPESKKEDVTVNTVFSNFHTILPNLYFRNPEITVTPTQPFFKRTDLGEVVRNDDGNPVLVDNYQSGKLFGIKLNRELKEIGFKNVIKRAVGNVLCPFGIGVVKVGFSKMTIGNAVESGNKYSYWVSLVDPRLFCYDPFANQLEVANWTCEQILLTRKQAKSFGIEVPKDYVTSLPEFIKDRQDKDSKSEDLISVYEFHDLQENVLYWLLDKNTEGSNQTEEDWAKEPEKNPYPFEGSSYAALTFNYDGEDIIGLSDVEPIEDQALSINRIRTKQTNHVDNFGVIVGYEDGALLPSDITSMKRGTNGLFLKFQKGGMGKFQITPTPSLGNDDYQMDGLNKDDNRNTLGITDYQTGGGKSRTATEANIISGSSNIRIDSRRDDIKEFIIKIVRKLAGLIQTFGEEEEFISIADVDLKEDFVKVLEDEYGFNPKIPFLRMKKEDIQGEYNYDFKVDDMVQVPKEVQAQQFMNFLNILKDPSLQAAIVEEGISLTKILKKTAEMMGVDLEELKKGASAQIPSLKENMMAENGMEIPEPHERDKDEEHQMIHSMVVEKLKAEVEPLMEKQKKLTEQMQKLQQAQMQEQQMQAQGLPFQSQIDPSLASQIQSEMKKISDEMKPINEKFRKIMLHMQQHTEKMARKQRMQAGNEASQQQEGIAAPTQQAQMQSQARGGS